MTVPTRVTLAAGGFAALAASAFLVIRVGAQETTPITLAGIRFVAASAGFAVLALLSRRLIRTDFRKRDIPLFLLTGAAGSVMYNLLLFKGQQTASAGTASLIQATIPIWASVMAVSIGKERLSAAAWLGVVIAFLGTVIMTVDPGALETFDLGAAFVVAAAMSNAVYYVGVKPLVIRYGALSAVAGTLWAGTFLFIPFMFYMEPISRWTPAAICSGLFLALCATLAGASLFAYVIGKVGVARASTVVYLVAPLVVSLEWLLFGDAPGTELLLGGTLTLTGLFLVRPRYKRDQKWLTQDYQEGLSTMPSKCVEPCPETSPT